MNWKKRIRKIAIWYLIFVVFAYAVLLIENRFGYMEEEVVSLNTPVILEQVPEVRITRADRSLMEKLFQYAEAELPNGGEAAVLENGEISAIVEECLNQEEMASALISIYFDDNRNILSLYWKQKNNVPVYLKMTQRGSEINYYKATGKRDFSAVGAFMKTGTTPGQWKRQFDAVGLPGFGRG